MDIILKLTLDYKKINISPKNNLKDWFTQDLWHTIFPYAEASVVWTHDDKPFWTYTDFITSIEWINKKFPGSFCDSDDVLTNKIEMAAFLGNLTQETGDPSVEAPYPWGASKPVKNGNPSEGAAGGCLAIMEGAIAQALIDGANYPNPAIKKAFTFPKKAMEIVRCESRDAFGCVAVLSGINQPGFGLGTGGPALTTEYSAVSDDGTLWGGNVLPKPSVVDRKQACLGPYCQYGGRGAIQLSYNFNYTDCSKALFNDLRLVRYPNLITTTDRETFNGNAFYFGFPGPNPGGDNKLPKDILLTTPPARQLAFITCLWFWASSDRSGRKVSCHYCMQNYKTHGITSCNIIINNQSGCNGTDWASKKVVYYKRICKILGIPESIVVDSIVCPSKIL